MKPSNDLYELIHSLSSSEKNYIKKYANIYTKNKQHYSKLFDAINKQKIYNEQTLLNKFRRESFVKHFAVTKNQLFDLILKLLRQYHQNSSVSALISAALENGKLLYEKGLPDLAFKQLDKAYKLAKKHGDYLKQEEIIDFKRHCVGQLHAHDWREEIDALLTEKENLAKASIKQTAQARKYYQILYLIRTNAKLRNTQQRVVLETIIPNGHLEKPQDDNFNSHLYYWNTLCLYYALKKEYVRSLEATEQIIALWNKHPEIRKSDPERYIASLNNYMTGMYRAQIYDGLSMLMSLLDKVNKKSVRIQAIAFENEALWKINHYQFHKDYEGFYKAIQHFESKLKRLKSSMNAARVFMIYRVITYVYFIRDNTPKLLEYIDITLEHQPDGIRSDENFGLHMMEFCNHYKMGNILLLDSSLKNYRRKIKKKGLLYDFEDFMLRLLKKLCTTANNKQATLATLTHFQEELTKRLQETPDLSLILYNNFSINIWMESIKLNCSMQDILAKDETPVYY